jgi:hypothetical protein
LGSEVKVPFVTPIVEWDSTPQNVNRRSLGTVGKRGAKSDGWYKGDGWGKTVEACGAAEVGSIGKSKKANADVTGSKQVNVD